MKKNQFLKKESVLILSFFCYNVYGDDMGAKYNNLVKLYNKKINVHEFYELKTFDELLNYSNNNSMFSMRFDREIDFHQLPFYKFNKKDFKKQADVEEYFNKIILEANKLNCSLLCSDGYLYDSDQICNFVIKIDDNQDFVLEWCNEKVAVREMYQYKTSILKGNIKEDLKDMQWISKNENEIDNKDIENIINWSFKIGIINKNIEGTLYPNNVGMLKEKIVCWQTD